MSEEKQPSQYKAKLMSNTEYERLGDTIKNEFKQSPPELQKIILNKYNEKAQRELLQTLNQTQYQQLAPLLDYENDMMNIGYRQNRNTTHLINKYPLEYHDRYFNLLSPPAQSNFFYNPDNYLPVFSRNYELAKNRFERNATTQQDIIKRFTR